MSKRTKGAWLAGVDGCKAGWIAVFVRPTGGYARPRIFSRFADVLTAPERPRIVVVDIPIGLLRRSELKGRAPERIVRPLIQKRGSSVFRVPSRAAIYAGIDPSVPDEQERWANSRKIARNSSVDCKAFAKQGFYLFGKIVEVDRLLRARKQLRRRIHESHPEVAFWMLNGKRMLPEPKTTTRGIMLRRQILLTAGFSLGSVTLARLKGATKDDLLDALACAAVARRIQVGKARRFPSQIKRDPCGIPMAIWA
jgi:predicted RNase H-like nuclease